MLIDGEQPETGLLLAVIRNIGAVAEKTLLCLEALIFVKCERHYLAVLAKVLVAAQYVLPSDLWGNSNHVQCVSLQDSGFTKLAFGFDLQFSARKRTARAGSLNMLLDFIEVLVEALTVRALAVLVLHDLPEAGNANL